ncbi:unnamed protein product [Chondrus crispus]|uniref:Uncharacterized protein n=1 Tax=Chondrus crispus TaxID=2769 RepID=R7QJR0_CHOCR|nr:unnamed protein product [Chondrus crispus]CDF38329.1 unnamed protein product [Chondrus crispus]|eukprot:XP_005718214.1 unnamed protein product [Chondrus crispus]
MEDKKKRKGEGEWRRRWSVGVCRGEQKGNEWGNGTGKGRISSDCWSLIRVLVFLCINKCCPNVLQDVIAKGMYRTLKKWCPN